MLSRSIRLENSVQYFIEDLEESEFSLIFEAFLQFVLSSFVIDGSFFMLINLASE